jgi:hypothetical protein
MRPDRIRPIAHSPGAATSPNRGWAAPVHGAPIPAGPIYLPEARATPPRRARWGMGSSLGLHAAFALTCALALFKPPPDLPKSVPITIVTQPAAPAAAAEPTHQADLAGAHSSPRAQSEPPPLATPEEPAVAERVKPPSAPAPSPPAPAPAPALTTPPASAKPPAPKTLPKTAAVRRPPAADKKLVAPSPTGNPAPAQPPRPPASEPTPKVARSGPKSLDPHVSQKPDLQIKRDRPPATSSSAAARSPSG